MTTQITQFSILPKNGKIVPGLFNSMQEAVREVKRLGLGINEIEIRSILQNIKLPKSKVRMDVLRDVFDMTETSKQMELKPKTMNKENELIELLSSLIGNIDAKIDWYKKFNQPISILGDAEVEMMHACMYDTLCMGSGGQGWDTNDRGESKSSHFLQSRKCNGCKEWDTRLAKPTWKYKKVMFFLDNCPFCGSSDLQSYDPDARFGISAKSHLAYIDELKGYRLTLLEPEQYNPDCRTFRLRTWFVETKNEYLNTYAEKQFESPKSNLINFQPLKADFYRSEPCLHLDLIISSNNINITYFDINNTIPENIPTQFRKYTIHERMSRKSFGKNRGEVIR